MRNLALWMLMLVFASSCVTAAERTDVCGPQDQVPEGDRIANTIHWTTASEQDNFGYDVYRGASEDGPFQKLTESPILGNGTTSVTQHYSYRDDSIDPCKGYWYYVESISVQGEREVFTPVVNVGPKAGPDAAKAAQASSAEQPSQSELTD